MRFEVAGPANAPEAGAARETGANHGVLAAVGSGVFRGGGTEQGDDRRADRHGDVHGAGVGGEHDGRVAEDGAQGLEGGFAVETDGAFLHAGEDVVDRGAVAGGAGEHDRQAGGAEQVGRAREVVGGPVLGRPPGHRVDRDEGGAVGDPGFGEEREGFLAPGFGRGEIERQGKAGEAEGVQQAEITFDGMGAGVADRDAAVEGEPGEFVVALAGAVAGFGGGPGLGDPEGAFDEALEIDGQVEACLAELPSEGRDRLGKGQPMSGAEEFPPVSAGPHEEAVQGGVIAEQVLGRILDQPGEVRLGVGAAEGGEGGQRVGDVAEGGELDDEDVHAADRSGDGDRGVSRRGGTVAGGRRV